MAIERATGVGPAKIEIAYERLGDPSAPPVLLIMGLNAQLVAWPEGFCAELLARGMQLVRFDNRDVGESTHMQGAPNFPAVMAGDLATVVYRLSDLAGDTLGLMDALGFESAHLVGASMGGYIAQTIAIEQPGRVRSLTSMMATTGARDVGQADPAVLQQLFAAGPPANREQAMQRAVDSARLIGSTGFPHDVDAIRARAGRAYDRNFDPLSPLRQGAAVVASGDRTRGLKALDVPTLVIHGDADKLCDVSGGRATAAAIPHAELFVIPGMGHDLPRGVWTEIAMRVATVVERGEARYKGA